MKKLLLLLLIALLAAGTYAFAADNGSPAEIYANLTGKSVEEAWQMRGQGRFGKLAVEEGVSEEFISQMLEVKKAQILSLVGDRLTQEEADTLIAELEERIAQCDGTGQQAQLLKGFGLRFGGQGIGNGQGEGYRQGNEWTRGNGRGCGGFRQGLQDGSGLRAQDGTCLFPEIQE